MSKKLLIVESPAKVKTIQKFLDSSFKVMSSVGHVRDLPRGKKRVAPTKGKADIKDAPKKTAEEKHFEKLGFNPKKNWEATYEVIPGKEKVVASLKKAAKEADSIILATDLDREGEAIAWHIQELLKRGSKATFQRIRFNEITKSAILDALSTPDVLNSERVDAYRARRFLDRLVGYEVSPILWRKLGPKLSAGRVQSVALRMLCEREREIRRFIPKAYWRIFLETKTPHQGVLFELSHEDNKPALIETEAKLLKLLERLKTSKIFVSKVTEKEERSKASPPFTTASLQRVASTRLNFAIKRTMSLAQKLYEGGHITYMRTDAVAISNEAMKSVRTHIQKQFGEEYLPAKPQNYSARAQAQEAHECIRPTSISLSSPPSFGEDEKRLYRLIHSRFLASQMTQARYMSTQILLDSKEEKGNLTLKTNGRRMLFDGYTRVWGSDAEDKIVPKFQEGQEIVSQKIEDTKHYTKPPSRFNEASLVSELEKRGIGRPSTYVAIISTLQEREYATLEKRRFFATPLGEAVSALLLGAFSDFMAYEFTASLEEKLDGIAKGKGDWKSLLTNFYNELNQQLEKASEKYFSFHEVTLPKKELPCPSCAREMVVKAVPSGIFLGCSGYGDKENPCKKTLSLRAHETLLQEEEEELQTLIDAKHCKICSARMRGYLCEDGQHQVWLCLDYPLYCSGHELETGSFEFSKVQPQGGSHPCDVCKNGNFVLKSGRFGDYYECHACGERRKKLSSQEVAMAPIPFPKLLCKKADDHFILREGDSGLFLAASKYPKVRETEAPSVTLLRSLKDNLPKRLNFLQLAPTQDENGLVVLITKDRKTKDWIAITRDEKGKRTAFIRHYDEKTALWVDKKAT